MPLTRHDLDATECEDPECHADHSTPELYFQPACHPGQGHAVRYVKATGLLEIACNTCGRPMAQIEVAPGRLDS
jgi:hypothetical protein